MRKATLRKKRSSRKKTRREEMAWGSGCGLCLNKSSKALYIRSKEKKNICLFLQRWDLFQHSGKSESLVTSIFARYKCEYFPTSSPFLFFVFYSQHLEARLTKQMPAVLQYSWVPMVSLHRVLPQRYQEQSWGPSRFGSSHSGRFVSTLCILQDPKRSSHWHLKRFSPSFPHPFQRSPLRKTLSGHLSPFQTSCCITNYTFFSSASSSCTLEYFST